MINTDTASIRRCLFGIILCLSALLLCASHADDRSFDGSGNNPNDASLGTAGSNFLRLDPNIHYGDGLSTPAGSGRPNPRDISNAVADQGAASITDPRGLTDMTWQWGQFLDHDLTLTHTNTGDPWNIPVTGPTDPLQPEIEFFRSVFDSATGSTTPRQQVNAITPFIDASNVYGSDTTRAGALRTNDSTGRLLVTSENLLPFNTTAIADPTLPNANPIPGLDDATLRVAGDVRANEQPGLLAMHTLFVREHNRLAVEIKTANPSWTGDQIYQEARRTVGAEIQAITYNEYLPSLLGNDDTTGISHAPDPTSFAYDNGAITGAQPGVSNEFAGALFRLGHTQLSSTLKHIDPDGVTTDIPLASAFFNPNVIVNEDDVDFILLGFCSQVMQKVDSFIIPDVRESLFGPPGAGGLDLAALNIQRGRDHGLPSYNEYRENVLGLSAATDFSDITTDADVQARLASVYTDIADIDLWVGVLAEDHAPGSSVGETLLQSIVREFTHIAETDSFFYLWDDEFTAGEIAALSATTLHDVIMRNATIDNLEDMEAMLQASVFVIPEPSPVFSLAGAFLFFFTRRPDRLRK